jgi:Ca-activated chloride channel family protein
LSQPWGRHVIFTAARLPEDGGTLKSQALGCLLAACAVASGAAGQVFRSGTRVVPIYATVTDQSGALVSDLAAADFQIDDNGKRQTISLFKSDVQPITIAILLDASPSLFPSARQTGAAVSEFVRRLMPDDRACLGTFSHAVTLDPALTSDTGALMRRLSNAAPWPAGTALWDAIDAGRSALRDEGGRRVVLVVSDGADNASRGDPDNIRTSLQREGVMVYAIGIRGRFGLDTSEIGALSNATGGRSVELKSAADIPSAMQSIADELHRQYVIGFSPDKLDDKLHRLDIKVKRAGLTVRARRSYIALKDDAR